DPCMMVEYKARRDMAPMAAAAPQGMREERAKTLRVTIEAQYTVGEYDILILGAKESNGLETWLKENGYKLPRGASAALAPYIRQGLKFFAANVHLVVEGKTG